jgi:trehalose 6-phosphate phosphatase
MCISPRLGAEGGIDHCHPNLQAKHPCALSHFSEFVSLIRGKRLAVFLDYDGTLTPIVPNPEDAILSEQVGGARMRQCGWMDVAPRMGSA